VPEPGGSLLFVAQAFHHWGAFRLDATAGKLQGDLLCLYKTSVFARSLILVLVLVFNVRLFSWFTVPSEPEPATHFAWLEKILFFVHEPLAG
jgi:hypothetical protein